MRIRILINVIKQGLQGMWRNRSMGLASIGSIAAVLIILGIVLTMILNINHIVEETGNKLDELHVLLDYDIKEETKEKVLADLKKIKEIENIEYIDRDEALEDIKEDWDDYGYLLEGLKYNPLQDSYMVQLNDIEKAKNVVIKIEGMEGVDEVTYFQELLDKLLKFTKQVQTGGFIIIIVLVLISVFIISNTIKITVSARKKEIEIMKYIGATNGYIRGPFLIEGVMFGLIASILSTGIVKAGYKKVFLTVNRSLSDLLTSYGSYVLDPKIIMPDITVIFIAIGVGIGALGSLISLKKFLDV